MGESGYSAKRKNFSDQNGSMSSAPKKPKIEDAEGSNEVVQFKVLIPSSAAGAIIGKKGETMRNLHEETGCKVKMSKNSEIYPHTNERVSFVQGPVSSTVNVVKFIMEKIRTKTDNNVQTDPYDLKNTERSKEMKIVVPASSAAMVIGKAGSFIKEIKEKTHVNIQIYPKQGSPEAALTSERVVTLAGTPEEVGRACEMILAKVASDPQHDSFPSISYAGVHHQGGPIRDDSSNNEPPSRMPPPFMDGPGPFERGRGPPGLGGPGGPGPMGNRGGGGPPPPQHSMQNMYPSGPGGPGGPAPFQSPGGQDSYLGAGGPPQSQQGPAAADYLSRGPPPPSHSNQSPFERGPPQQQQQQQQPPPQTQDVSRGGSYGGLVGGGNQLGGGMNGGAPPPVSQAPSAASAGAGGDFKFNPLEGLGNQEVLSFLDNLQATLRSSGFNEQQVADIMQAMQVLAKYNIMGLGLGLGVAAMATMRSGAESVSSGNASQQQQQPQQQPPPQQHIQQEPPPQQLQQQQAPPPAVAYGTHAQQLDARDRGAPPPQNVVSSMDYNSGGGASPFDLRPSYPPTSQAPVQQQYGGSDMGGGGSGYGGSPAGGPWDRPPADRSHGFAATVVRQRPQTTPTKLELDIPEPIVGAVLGPKASTLQEIKRYSGASVEVQKRQQLPGVPPSKYRTVVIMAANSEAVQIGRRMVENAINDEQARRQPVGY